MSRRAHRHRVSAAALFLLHVSAQVNGLGYNWIPSLPRPAELHLAIVGALESFKRGNEQETLSQGSARQCMLALNPLADNGGASASLLPGPPHSSSSTPTPAAHRTSTAPKQSSTEVQSSPWILQHYHSGNSFFDEWTFNTGADPTHGNVDYADSNTAFSNNLTYINSQGNAVMRVDTTQTVALNRGSVRITTNYQFTGGLLILDAVHVPVGCATWPAFWTNGPNWPNNGEIDIVEGVNDLTVNQASVHTGVGCSIPNTQTAAGATGTLVGPSDCASVQTNNGGCAVQATSLDNTFGPGFNSNGGGVYATVWDDNGIAIYFFDRQSIPSDIESQKPSPDLWGEPFAKYPSRNCSPFQFFQNHWAIFDTTLCGDWAGNVWDSTSSPGQEQSCAQRTSVPTCTQFVQQRGDAFIDAYWEVKSVALYQDAS